MRTAIYTALIGGYEDLNELTIPSEPGVDRICLTDNPDLVSSTWQVVQVTAAFAADPIRSQRLLKIAGHPAVDMYDATLYIDNTVKLHSSVTGILALWLDGADIAIPTHGFRSSVIEEFHEVMAGGLDSRERLVEQLEHYSEEYPAAIQERPFWNGMIARRRSPANIALSVAWAQHVLRYSRRDQLSLTVAMAVSGTQVRRIELDNYNSEVHTWPILSNRKVDRRLASGPDYFGVAEGLRAELAARQAQLDRTLQESAAVQERTMALLTHAEMMLAGKSEALEEILASTSWKFTGQLRFLTSVFRRRRCSSLSSH